MAEQAEQEADLRSIHTTSLLEMLQRRQFSFLVSTYQAGKLIVVRADGDVLNTHFRNFDTPMGVSFEHGRLAVGTKHHVREFRNHSETASRLTPAGNYDACFLPRWAHVTGLIGVHDVAWAGNELWVVNTAFSCLCTIDREYSFVPRWRPSFITAMGPGDRCHLNGLAVRDGQPRYVSALGETDSVGGWRPGMAHGGCLMDIASGEVILRGLSMPHSPRWYDGRLWFLESGSGSLAVVDLDSGRVETITLLPGFTRGLCFYGPFAFVGLSQVRHSALFKGLPITDRLPVEQRKCGVWVIDTRNGDVVALLQFEAGVQEIFAVEVLPGMTYPELLTDEMPGIGDTFVLPDAALAEVKRS